jgi:hypothetical protein
MEWQRKNFLVEYARRKYKDKKLIEAFIEGANFAYDNPKECYEQMDSGECNKAIGIDMWVARDAYNSLRLYSKKPVKVGGEYEYNNIKGEFIELNQNLLPYLEYKDGPRQVKLFF